MIRLESPTPPNDDDDDNADPVDTKNYLHQYDNVPEGDSQLKLLPVI